MTYLSFLDLNGVKNRIGFTVDALLRRLELDGAWLRCRPGDVSVIPSDWRAVWRRWP